MFSKTKFLTALVFSVLLTAIHVEAQTYSSKSKRSSYKRRSDTGVVLVAGAGVSVLNSDNRVHDFQGEGLGPLRNNGLGQNYNLGIMYRMSPMISLLGSLDYHGFKAAEGMDTDESYNVAFRSQAYIASGSVVVNLVNRYSGRSAKLVIPYIKAGFGAASYSASSFLVGDGGKEIKLSNLRGYPALAAVVPVGAGLDFRFSSAISVSPEVSFNLTSTDYLDNMPDEVGAFGKNDHFINASIKVFYTPDARKYVYKKKRQY
ncbi:hypothetical protein [Pontibacter pamirensis]|uniref:hypothetical protein n=1 Tax=Pontibacter pamirensis TaxID=2562824 RepID=UPI00138A01B3|nr:hypothetical protein [Pontibacter pamirensis]